MISVEGHYMHTDILQLKQQTSLFCFKSGIPKVNQNTPEILGKAFFSLNSGGIFSLERSLEVRSANQEY